MTILPPRPPPIASSTRARTSSRDGLGSSPPQQPTSSSSSSSASSIGGHGAGGGGGADTRRRVTKLSKAREREKGSNVSRLVDYFCVVSSVAEEEIMGKNDSGGSGGISGRRSNDKTKKNDNDASSSSSSSSTSTTTTTTTTTTAIIDGSEFVPRITSRYPTSDYDGHALNYEGTVAFCYPSGRLPVFVTERPPPPSSYDNDGGSSADSSNRHDDEGNEVISNNDDNSNNNNNNNNHNNNNSSNSNSNHNNNNNNNSNNNNNNNNNNNHSSNDNGGGKLAGTENHMPKVHYFVNTNEAGQRIYGTCLTIWEGHTVTLAVTTTATTATTTATTTTKDVDTANDGQPRAATAMTTYQQRVIYLPKCLVILSQHPYLVAFREYLTQLHRLSRMVPPDSNDDDDNDVNNNNNNNNSCVGKKICTTTVKSTSKLMKQVLSLPIERYIVNFCSELPAPPSGSFQVQTTILDSIISIWCPPSNMPIPWVSLPFTHLFQCLDVNNVIRVWMALALERQVLVTSTQLSLLTTVCEILLSLLFPLKWSHAYIPILPHFLVPILSAPMPFLCGIDKNHLCMALGDLSDECLVVDLDKNVVSPGVNMKPIPSLPKFVHQRLLSKVESSAGHVHREVRSLRPRDNNSEGGVHLPPELKDVADAMWESRLCLFDEAFMLMFTPEERRKNWLNGDDGSGAGGGLAGSNNIDPILLMFSERQGNLLRAQSQWDAVQEAFVDVNCFLLQKYRKFLVFPSKHNEGSYGGAGFRSQEFLAAQRVDVRDFLEEMVGGQMFDEFITKRLYGSGEADISFFDGAVDRYVRNNGLVANVSGFVRQTSTGGEGGGMPPVGKNLRNMFGGGGNALPSTVNNERDPPLLQSARVKRELKTIVPPEPGGLDLPDDILLEGISNGVVVLVNTRKEADDVGVVSAHDDTDDDAISVTSASTATSVSTAASKAKQTAGRVYYHYPVFPERLDPKLFGKPRGLSSAVRAEYDRQRENVGKFRRTKSSEIDEDEIGTEGGASSARSMAVTGQKGPVEKPATAEVTTFTVFFMTFTAVVGKDLMAVDNDSLDQLDSKAIVSTYKKGKEKRQVDEDVDDIGRLVDEIVMDANQPSTPTRRDRTSKLSPGKGMANRKQPDSPVRNRFNDKLSTLKIMEAKETAKAELEIAFEMLDMMKERGLRADPEAYQCLIDACGRCGDTDRATQLLVRMHDDGIVADGVVYSSLVSAFSTDNAWKQASGEVREELPDWANGASIDMDWNSLKVQKRSYIDIVKEKLVDEKFKRFVNRNMPHQNKDTSSSSNTKHINKNKANGYTEQYVTDHVLRQIVLGENLLEVVYPDISIDTDNEFCPRCNYYLSDDDVVNGWVAGNAQEYKTECPNCLTKFVPHFCVQSTLPSFVGSRGPSSALFCERLSPWVLKKELRSVISGGIDDLLSPEWREKESKNAVLYWNLILSFMRYRFPFTFLLQGSFSSSLIAPTPDTNDVEVGL